MPFKLSNIIFFRYIINICFLLTLLIHLLWLVHVFYYNT
nr:MAG TPA_asm: hypothetical protein [Caudoviricetes sp.]